MTNTNVTKNGAARAIGAAREAAREAVVTHRAKKSANPKRKQRQWLQRANIVRSTEKKQHPTHFSTDQCIWNKKAVYFRYASMCKQMGLEYVKWDKFEKGNEDKWPKNKAKTVKDNKKEDNND